MRNQNGSDQISGNAKGPDDNAANRPRRLLADLPLEVLANIKSGENAVRAIRRHRLLTQRELSEMTGLGENHISNIENGAQFNIRTAKKLAVALEVLIDDIS